ncbi:MAG: TolC family protein [Campylobacterales bacterium]
MKRWLALALLPVLLSGRQVTFHEAARAALEHNEELKSRELEVKRTNEEVRIAQAMGLGRASVGITAGYTNNPLHVFGSKLASHEASFADFGFDQFLANMSGLTTTTADSVLAIKPEKLNNPSPRLNIESSISYELPLFTGYKLTSARTMADLQRRANEIKLKHDRKLLVREVLNAYNGVVLAKEFIAALKIAKTATSGFVKMAKDFSDAGMALKSDILEAQSYEADVDAKMIEAEGQRDLALAYLRFLTGRDEIDDVTGYEDLSAQISSLASMKEKALENREDLAWMRLNVKTMKEKIRFESAENYPMVGLMAKYGFNDNGLTLSGKHDFYMLGLGVGYTLYDWGKRDAEIQKARIDYNKMALMESYMGKGIALEVEKAWIEYRSKEGALRQKEAALALAEEVLEQMRGRYQYSLITMSQLLLKQADAQRARAEVAKARYELIRAAADLAIAQGIEIVKD